MASAPGEEVGIHGILEECRGTDLGAGWVVGWCAGADGDVERACGGGHFCSMRS
jgi:hypothetical protein